MNAMTKIKLMAATKALNVANGKVKEFKKTDWYLAHKEKKKAIKRRRFKRNVSILGALSAVLSSYLVYIHRFSIQEKIVTKVDEVKEKIASQGE